MTETQQEPRHETELIKTSTEVDQVFAALVGAQGEAIDPPMLGDNPHFGSKYATLEDTIEVCRPVLAKHNLAVLSGPISGDGWYGSVVRLVHKSGQWVELSARVKASRGVQELGSVQTYLRRYCLSGLLNTSGESDDDGEGAEGRGSRRPKPAKAKGREDWTGQLASRLNQPPPPPPKPAPAPPKPQVVGAKNDGTSWIKTRVGSDFAGWATVCKNKDHSEHADASYAIASNCTSCRGILRWILSTDAGGEEGSELRKRAQKIVSFVDNERRSVQELKTEMKACMSRHGIRRPQWREAIYHATAGKASSFPDLSKWSLKEAQDLLVVFEKSGEALAKELGNGDEPDAT